VFLVCALAAGVATLAAAASAHSYPALVAWRALTGVCLAGIYPVGMKIAAQWFPRGLGAALGWLVGALVVGSASAHALRALATGGAGLPWQAVFVAVALLCAAAGLAMVWLVPEPPTPAPGGRGGPAPTLRIAALASLWRDRRVRASVFGYFGHMWELYTVWVLMPAILATRLADSVAISWWAFVALGAGALGCIGGGLLVGRYGSARVAAVQLAASGLCCLAAPWMLQAATGLFLAWAVLWGITVVGDSPQFSALTAANAPREAVGSVLTLTNSIGFAVSALSIEVFVRAAAAGTLAQVRWARRSGCLPCDPCWRSAPEPRRRAVSPPAPGARLQPQRTARGAGANPSGADAPPHRGHVTQRPDLDAAVAGPGPLLRQTHRLVDRRRLHEVEAGQHLLGLGERPVQHLRLPAADAHRLGRDWRLQLLVAEQRAAGLQVVGVPQAVAHVRVELAGRQFGQKRVVGINEQQELHVAAPRGGAGSCVGCRFCGLPIVVFARGVGPP
jgi:MFS family permease